MNGNKQSTEPILEKFWETDLKDLSPLANSDNLDQYTPVINSVDGTPVDDKTVDWLRISSSHYETNSFKIVRYRLKKHITWIIDVLISKVLKNN